MADDKEAHPAITELDELTNKLQQSDIENLDMKLEVLEKAAAYFDVMGAEDTSAVLHELFNDLCPDDFKSKAA